MSIKDSKNAFTSRVSGGFRMIFDVPIYERDQLHTFLEE